MTCSTPITVEGQRSRCEFFPGRLAVQQTRCRRGARRSAATTRLRRCRRATAPGDRSLRGLTHQKNAVRRGRRGVARGVGGRDDDPVGALGPAGRQSCRQAWCRPGSRAARVPDQRAAGVTDAQRHRRCGTAGPGGRSRSSAASPAGRWTTLAGHLATGVGLRVSMCTTQERLLSRLPARSAERYQIVVAPSAEWSARGRHRHRPALRPGRPAIE